MISTTSTTATSDLNNDVGFITSIVTGDFSVSGNISIGGTLTYEDVTNVDSVGLVTARSGIKVPDSQKINVGTSDDLQIYHDGNHSYIDDGGTGNLRLRSGTLEITNLVGSKKSAEFCLVVFKNFTSITLRGLRQVTLVITGHCWFDLSNNRWFKYQSGHCHRWFW